MRFLRTWTGRIFAAVGLLLLVLGGAATVFYATDQAVAADVTGKSCNPVGGSAVTAKTRIFGHVQTVGVDYASCRIVPVGAYVLYHVRSERTIVFEVQGGNCIWDSATGPC
jgi:uncharacterized protein YabE (DUF348 family)